MPLPEPQKDEKQKDFMTRCLSDKKMREEFGNIKQRIAVCMTTFKDSKKNG